MQRIPGGLSEIYGLPNVIGVLTGLVDPAGEVGGPAERGKETEHGEEANISALSAFSVLPARLGPDITGASTQLDTAPPLQVTKEPEESLAASELEHDTRGDWPQLGRQHSSTWSGDGDAVRAAEEAGARPVPHDSSTSRINGGTANDFMDRQTHTEPVQADPDAEVLMFDGDERAGVAELRHEPAHGVVAAALLSVRQTLPLILGIASMTAGGGAPWPPPPPPPPPPHVGLAAPQLAAPSRPAPRRAAPSPPSPPPPTGVDALTPLHRRRLNKPPSTPPTAPPSTAGLRLPNETSISLPPPLPLGPSPPLWSPPIYAPLPEGRLADAALTTVAIQIDLGFAIIALALAIFCAGASHLFGRALKEWCRREAAGNAPMHGRRRIAAAAEAHRALREAHRALRGSSAAVPEWQRAVVAIGARPANGSTPTLVGSGFVVHLPSASEKPPILTNAGSEPWDAAQPSPPPPHEVGAIICTCAHVLDDIRSHGRRRAVRGEVATARLNTPPAEVPPEGSDVAPASGSPLLDPYADSVAVGWGSPVVWRYAAVVRRVSPPPAPRDPANGLDLALLELSHPIPWQPARATSSASSLGSAALRAPTPDSLCKPRAISSSFEDLEHGPPGASVVAPAAAGQQGVSLPGAPAFTRVADAADVRLAALPLGDDLRLRLGDDLVLLGYSRTARNQPPSATNTRGVFAGRWDDDTTGQWLRTDALMLGGHSGGPLINCLGEVVGWSVRSNFDPVVHGAGFYAAGLNEVRPVRGLLAELRALLGPDVPLEGSMPAGLLMSGPAAAREAMRALEAALSLHAPISSSDDEDRPPAGPVSSCRPLQLPRRFPRRLHAGRTSALPPPAGAADAAMLRIKSPVPATDMPASPDDGRARKHLDWREAPSSSTGESCSFPSYSVALKQPCSRKPEDGPLLRRTVRKFVRSGDRATESALLDHTAPLSSSFAAGANEPPRDDHPGGEEADADASTRCPILPSVSRPRQRGAGTGTIYRV